MHTHKGMIKILQVRLQQYVNRDLLDVQAGYRKGRGTRDQIANIHWIIKTESSRKIYISALLTMLKPLILWLTTNCGTFLKTWEHQTTLLASWEICMQLTMDWFQIGQEYVRAVYCHPAYLTYMQSTSREMPGWMKHKLESRFLGEISITSYMQMTSPLWQKVKMN